MLILLGVVLYAWGHVVLGRITGWPTMHDPVVRRGPYGVVRHPITDGALLAALGVFLVRPTQSVALAGALSIVGLVLQTKLEEIDLLQRLPAYAAYKTEVPWLVPRVPARRRHR